MPSAQSNPPIRRSPGSLRRGKRHASASAIGAPATRVGVIGRLTRRDYVPARDRSLRRGAPRLRQAGPMATGNRVRVGVLAPIKIELRSVVEAFSLQPAQINGVAVHTGVVGNAEIVATPTGIGTALATTATEQLLGLGEFDRVMVV